MAAFGLYLRYSLLNYSAQRSCPVEYEHVAAFSYIYTILSHHHDTLTEATAVAGLSASIADSLGSGEHGRSTIDAAVGDNARGSGELEVGELAAHAGIVLSTTANLRDGGKDARILIRVVPRQRNSCYEGSLLDDNRCEKLTPQTGILSTSGQSAWRLTAGLAEATAARVAMARVANCIVAIGLRNVFCGGRVELGVCLWLCLEGRKEV